MTIECEDNRLPSCIVDWVVRYRPWGPTHHHSPEKVPEQVVAVPGAVERQRFTDGDKLVHAPGSRAARERPDLGWREAEMRDGLIVGFGELGDLGEIVGPHMGEESGSAGLPSPYGSLGQPHRQELLMAQFSPQILLAGEIEDEVQSV
jgi:hypothetical protein